MRLLSVMMLRVFLPRDTLLLVQFVFQISRLNKLRVYTGDLAKILNGRRTIVLVFRFLHAIPSHVSQDSQVFLPKLRPHLRTDPLHTRYPLRGVSIQRQVVTVSRAGNFTLLTPGQFEVGSQLSCTLSEFIVTERAKSMKLVLHLNHLFKLG